MHGMLLSTVIPRAALLGISEKTLGQPLPQVRAAHVLSTSAMDALLHTLMHAMCTVPLSDSILTWTNTGSATCLEPNLWCSTGV